MKYRGKITFPRHAVETAIYLHSSENSFSLFAILEETGETKTYHTFGTKTIPKEITLTEYIASAI